MADVTKEIALEVSLKDSTSAGTQSAKSRLKSLREEMVQLAQAGQQNTDRFRQLETQAGELSDTISDTQQRIKNVGSDTRNIEAFTQAVQGVAAGFQLAQVRQHFSVKRMRMWKKQFCGFSRQWLSLIASNK